MNANLIVSWGLTLIILAATLYSRKETAQGEAMGVDVRITKRHHNLDTAYLLMLMASIFWSLYITNRELNPEHPPAIPIPNGQAATEVTRDKDITCSTYKSTHDGRLVVILCPGQPPTFTVQ